MVAADAPEGAASEGETINNFNQLDAQSQRTWLCHRRITDLISNRAYSAHCSALPTPILMASLHRHCHSPLAPAIALAAASALAFAITFAISAASAIAAAPHA